MEWLSDPSAWVALLTLALLEIVLGIDNIIFISILSGKLPPEQRKNAWRVGLSLALIMRILLLLSISALMKLTEPIIQPIESIPFLSHGLSGKDLILLGGGLFLIYKAVKEIHEKLEGAVHTDATKPKTVSFAGVIAQILIIDLVFSLDSVITAVGMADDVGVMITAVIIAVGFMLVFAEKLGAFVEKHPTVKMLALAFLVLIGVNLVTEAFHQPIQKGFTYFAMAFSVIVEFLNMKLRGSNPVALHGKPEEAVSKDSAHGTAPPT